MTDRALLDQVLASAVDFTQPGNICCGGCYPIPETATTFAYYTAQDVERAFSDDGERPVGERTRYSSWDDEDYDDPYADDDDGTREYPEPSYPGADDLVAPLYIGYGLRDKSVWSEEACTEVRQKLVKALNDYGFVAEDPGDNSQRIKIEGVQSVRFLDD